MPIGLKSQISQIVQTLKEAKKHKLAECIEKNWDKTALEYSGALNSWRPKKPMEKELLNAFAKELERLGMESVESSEVLQSIKKRRVLQTAPHLGATESPRMFCINWLGSLAVAKDDFYVVAMFSGIPFSNRSRPGRINRKNGDINLFPSSMQDGLVYRSTIPKKLLDSLNDIPDPIHRLLPKAVVGNSYTKWALETSSNIEKKVLDKDNLVFLDINEVVTEYLLQVFKKRYHILHKILFEPKTREEFAKIFPNEIMFYTPVLDGKYEVMENMALVGSRLKSKHKEIDLNNKEALIKEIREGRLCPGLILSFLVLAFMNQFKCFGSFAQVEYLPSYQEKFSKLKFLKEFGVEKVPTANLTTGVFPEDKNLYPVDIIMTNRKFKPNPKTLFGELLLPMKDVLLESYFTGDARKK